MTIKEITWNVFVTETLNTFNSRNNRERNTVIIRYKKAKL